MIAQRKRMDIQTWSGRRGGGVGRGGDVAVDVCCCCLPTTFYLETCVHLPDETRIRGLPCSYTDRRATGTRTSIAYYRRATLTLSAYTRGDPVFFSSRFLGPGGFFFKNIDSLSYGSSSTRVSLLNIFSGFVTVVARRRAPRRAKRAAIMAREKNREKKIELRPAQFSVDSDPHSF